MGSTDSPKSPCPKSLGAKLNSLSRPEPNCSSNSFECKTRQPNSCRLAYLPDHVLQDIFVLAGPGNNLNVTCRYFNSFFKFEDTGFDETGHWHNLHLVQSMIKVHFLRDLNREIKRYNFPLSYVDELCKRYDEVHDEFASLYDRVDILKDRLTEIKIFLHHIKREHCYVDPEILFFRFATQKVVKALCSRFTPKVDSQTSSVSWPICFGVIETNEPEKRLGLVAGFFREAFYWLHEYPNQPENMLPHNIDAVSHNLLVSDYSLGGELSVIDKAFGGFRHFAADAKSRRFSYTNSNFDRPPERTSDSDPSVYYLKEGPSFFRRLGAILEIGDFEIYSLDGILLALFDSCANYRIPQGCSLLSLTERVSYWSPAYSCGDEIDSSTVSKVLRIYQSLKMKNDSCGDPNFNIHDWCEAITLIHNYANHSCSLDSWCGRAYCQGVEEIDIPLENFVDGLIEKILDVNVNRKVEDWMEHS